MLENQATMKYMDELGRAYSGSSNIVTTEVTSITVPLLITAMVVFIIICWIVLRR